MRNPTVSWRGRQVGAGAAGLVIGPLAEATSRRLAFGAGGGIAVVAIACTVPLAAWAARRGAVALRA
jgi:hypothetical protein